MTKTFYRVNHFNVLQRLLECGFPLKLVYVCVLPVVQKYEKLYFIGK